MIENNKQNLYEAAGADEMTDMYKNTELSEDTDVHEHAESSEDTDVHEKTESSEKTDDMETMILSGNEDNTESAKVEQSGRTTGKKEKQSLTPYDRVQLARKKSRPKVTDYIEALFDDFIELKGDRLLAEDKSIVGGIALFHGRPVTVIGHRKGRTTEENIKYNFGMTSPEGYRKALRLMKQAEKFSRPVITFIDTPGAYPGMEAEAHGQSTAIAECIAAMSCLKTPVIAIITGEGSSGGALAIGVADSVWMQENAVYSILSPEGFATIIWKDAKKAPEASEVMKITAQELYEFGLIDGILPEGKKCFPAIDNMLKKELERLSKYSKSALVTNRYKKFREIDGI